ncbi:MAG: PDZ domain-containing protein, partial [Anaerolineae bacterium]|nr:PDZ domain-containing protein [Anaerolineae bacterium]
MLIVFLLAIAKLPSAAAVTPSQDAENSQRGSTPVRNCLYVPGLSIPATMPEEVIATASPTPLPTSTLPSTTPVDAATTAQQLEVLNGVWNAVNDHYVYADFRGRDWATIGATYQAIVEGGLSDEAFYRLMGAMINELGDEHSYFQSPAQVAQEAETLARGNDFVGIGALFSPIPPGDTATILSVFPNSPAAEAGLLPHDVLLAVDGGPIRDEAGISRTRGPEGSIVTLTIQRAGTVPHEITITRRRVMGSLPIDFCLIPDTRIGYIFFPTFFDESIADQTRAALVAMTADGPLDGLILDNRMNGGGLGSVASAVLGFFTSGVQGYFVSRESRDPLDIVGEDIGGSQTVPLIVLVDRDTVSY